MGLAVHHPAFILRFRCHATIFWGQLTTNYLLSREVKPQDRGCRLREWRWTGHCLTLSQNQGRRHSWLWLVLHGRFWNQLIILSTSEGTWQDGGHQCLCSLKSSEVLEHFWMLSWFWWLFEHIVVWIFWGLNRVWCVRSDFLMSRVFTSFKLPAALLFSQALQKEPKLLWRPMSHRSPKTLITIKILSPNLHLSPGTSKKQKVWVPDWHVDRSAECEWAGRRRGEGNGAALVFKCLGGKSSRETELWVTSSQKCCQLLTIRVLLGARKLLAVQKIGCFCSFQSSGAEINLPLHSPSAQRTRRKVPPAFAMVSEKELAFKRRFQFESEESRAWEQRERDITRQTPSRRRRWEGREGALIALRERWRHKGRREGMCDWIWPSGELAVC